MEQKLRFGLVLGRLAIKVKSLEFYYHSIKVHTQEAQNLYQLTSLHKIFKNCFLLNDGAKRNRFLHLKIMYTVIRKILYLQ
jgi:hypothetical protein